MGTGSLTLGTWTVGRLTGTEIDCEPTGAETGAETGTETGAVDAGTGATTGPDLGAECVAGAAECWTVPGKGCAATMTTAALATAVAVQRWLAVSLSQRPERSTASPYTARLPSAWPCWM